ncbi:MAG: tetratricopeptide repeat protein, partial [Pirellulaceae bacterium]|nr:tetratricopeptide repeat protein [Pirellulaceae bacterium]
MTLARSLRFLAFALSSGLFVASIAIAQDPPVETGGSSAVTSLPEIDRSIHDAMQSRSYGDAVKLIEAKLGQADVANADYLRYLQGVAQSEAKQYDAAINTFESLEKDYPKSKWLSRSRFGRANVYALKRQYIDAGAIYQSEAERLLSRGRKDDLAKIYLEFADRYFEGLPADDPTKAKKPNFKQALTYYSEAVKLGPTDSLRLKIDFRIARCHDELKQHDPAIQSYERFLNQFAGDAPTTGTAAPIAMQVEATFRLGSVQLDANRPSQARKTWRDLLSEWKDRDHRERTESEEIDSYLARAEFRLAHTYGLPKPNSVGDLELAVTAAEKFLANHPDHKLAPQAVLEIAQGYAAHGRHKQAVARLQALIENDNYSDCEQIPTARQLLGAQFLAQGEFDQAIAAWKEFLDKHPTDPKWPEVQRKIVDAEYAKAITARRDKEFAQARTMWQTFLNKYPLDSRAPRILLQFGQMKFAQAMQQHDDRVSAALEKGDSAQSVEINDACKSLFEESIADWRRVVSKYPNSNEASEASYMIGVTLEDKLFRLDEALESYKTVKGRFAQRAKQRTDRLTSPQLSVTTERKFRSDEKPRIKLTTRNLKNVTVKAYRVDMVDYFRKMHLASGLETLDIALIDPDEQFDHSVDNYKEYQQSEEDIELPIDGPGVTAVTVSSEELEATTMVVVSDLDMIVKSSRNEMFLFVENMRTGKPAEGVSVLISDGSDVFAEEITSEDGIVQKPYDELKSVGDLRVFAVQQGHMASTVNNLQGLDFSVGLTPRGYLYTDRPAYRSGQLVNIKGIVRWVDHDRFTFRSGETFKLDVYDARGRQLQTKEVVLNDYGTVNSNIILPEFAPQGDYRVHLHRASAGEADAIGELSFETQFKVTQYKLEPVQIEIDLDKDVYFRGEKVKGTLSLKYYYGTPLAGETIEYHFGPDSELFTAKTDDNGEVEIELDTQRFSESQPLDLAVNDRERGLTQTHRIYLATRGFAITGSTVREVYINGESFETLFKVVDPAGKPVQTDLKIEVYRQTSIRDRLGEKLVQTHQVSTDAKRGEARQVVELDDGGVYFVRATGVDQFDNKVSGQVQVAISGDKDAT